MKSARQALADLAALLTGADYADYEGAGPAYVQTDAVWAVLADVEPERPVVWNRDAARDVLKRQDTYIVDGWHEDLLDALEGCMRPAPAQTIDRDALSDLLEVVLPTRAEMTARGTSLEIVVGAVLALLRPVDGVTLTREEAADIARVLRNTGGRDVLAARLEAAS